MSRAGIAFRSWFDGIASGPMGVVGHRLVLSVPLLFIVSILIFLLMAFAPGDVTERVLGPRISSGLPEQQYQDLAHQLGVDEPLPLQYWNWLSAAAQGDLGRSLVTTQAVSTAIAQRVPVTLSLVIGALVVSLIIGVSLGVISAVRGGALGRVIDALAMAGWALPVFWIAAELVVIFAVKLRWFPAIGYVPLTQSPIEWARSLVLPVFALALAPIGTFAKYTRDSMLDALSSEYVRMARASGISPMSVIWRHAFRTASVQVLTVAGLWTVGLLVGAVFVEQVFALPGLGSLIVTGAHDKDVPMVQGVAVFFTLIVIAVNLVVDLAYGLLSPRVRVR